jgi:NAD(P)-dependent dehydrogenase (short-subunit alcohol dehydrogenase family)
MSLSIENKIALVTGANRGIGKAIVESFLEHGAKKVYLAVRNPESTRELAQKYGDKVVTLQVDVADADSIKNLAEHAKDVNVVVNNAGVLEIADPLSSNVEEALTKELNINVFGLIRIAKAFAPILEANSGALVQLNSVASIKILLDSVRILHQKPPPTR